MGYILIVMVHAANIYDGRAAREVLSRLFSLMNTVKKIWADGTYMGEELAQWIKAQFQCDLEVVNKKKRVRVFKFYRAVGLWSGLLHGSVDLDD